MFSSSRDFELRNIWSASNAAIRVLIKLLLLSRISCPSHVAAVQNAQNPISDCQNCQNNRKLLFGILLITAGEG
jgi:hypothetical protein